LWRSKVRYKGSKRGRGEPEHKAVLWNRESTVNTDHRVQSSQPRTVTRLNTCAVLPCHFQVQKRWTIAPARSWTGGKLQDGGEGKTTQRKRKKKRYRGSTRAKGETSVAFRGGQNSSTPLNGKKEGGLKYRRGKTMPLVEKCSRNPLEDRKKEHEG